MTPATRYAKVRECCLELVALLPLSIPYQRERFTTGLGRLLGSTVHLCPLPLPLARPER